MNKASVQEWGSSLTQFTQNPHKHQTLRRQPVAERSRCSSIRQRWGAVSSSNAEREGRGEGWGYENDWWEHKWQSCDREEWGGGEWRETRDNADSWAGLPVRPSLVFRLDLQVLDGTLAGAVLENKNRCHKTPLRLGFASVMTPLEMPRVWCSQQKPVRYALGVVFITNSAATYLPSLLRLTMMENSFFVFSTQRGVVYISTFLNVQLCVHLWQNQTYMFNDTDFEWRFYIIPLVRYSWKRFHHSWELGV